MTCSLIRRAPPHREGGQSLFQIRRIFIHNSETALTDQDRMICGYLTIWYVQHACADLNYGIEIRQEIRA